MGHNGETSFGNDLRRSREQQGLSVEAVSHTTKVSQKHIRALEAGEFQELPGGVFRRGFVRSYVGALGLEEVGWMKRFDEVCRAGSISGAPDSDWTRFAENVKNNRPSSPPMRAARGIGFALLLIALVVAVWCGWRLTTHRRLLPTPLVGKRAPKALSRVHKRNLFGNGKTAHRDGYGIAYHQASVNPWASEITQSPYVNLTTFATAKPLRRAKPAHLTAHGSL